MTDYERGRWEMFLLCSCAEYGKQCYFLQDDGTVYSRESGRYMSVADAETEFLNRLEDL